MSNKIIYIATLLAFIGVVALATELTKKHSKGLCRDSYNVVVGKWRIEKCSD